MCNCTKGACTCEKIAVTPVTAYDAQEDKMPTLYQIPQFIRDMIFLNVGRAVQSNNEAARFADDICYRISRFVRSEVMAAKKQECGTLGSANIGNTGSEVGSVGTIASVGGLVGKPHKPTCIPDTDCGC